MLNKVVYSALIKMNGYALTINHSICLKSTVQKLDYGTSHDERRIKTYEDIQIVCSLYPPSV
ncbi:hypothetical protein ECMP0215613_4953 [Escherichia coli MP021561.3]|nr:hypothetical protein ECMP0215613_4953 [Escherichia coli MP021561.3]